MGENSASLTMPCWHVQLSVIILHTAPFHLYTVYVQYVYSTRTAPLRLKSVYVQLTCERPMARLYVQDKLCDSGLPEHTVAFL